MVLEEGRLQAGEGLSPHKGTYLHSPHSLNDTETHNPSKSIGDTLTWVISAVYNKMVETGKRLGHIYHGAIIPNAEGRQTEKV